MMAETKQTPKQGAKPEDLHYMRDLHAAMLEQSAPKVIWALYLIGVVLIAALIWASLAEVEEITEVKARSSPSAVSRSSRVLRAGYSPNSM